MMGKFQHTFYPVEQTETHRLYTDGSVLARLDFVGDASLRVAVYRRGETLLPTFDVAPDNVCSACGRERLSTAGFPLCAPETETTKDGERFRLPCGVEVTLAYENFRLSYRKDGAPLFADRPPLAYNFGGEFGAGAYHYVTREPGERVYGLGDKGGTLDKAGRAFRIETTDCMGFDAETSDPLYKHIPFYICETKLGSYGLFYDTPATAYIDLGREHNNYYPPYKYFCSEEDALVYYVFFGTPLQIVQQFGRLCGRQAFPPKWSFDYCGSTMAYTDAENAEEEMDGFLRDLQAHDLSCGGFYLSSGYTSIGDKRCVFHWNREKFPDPKAFVRRFQDAGVALIPNIKPAFLESHPLYDKLRREGLFVCEPDGTPYVTQFWDGLGSYLDFTNPAAYAFWREQVKTALLDYGICATWNDNNEFDIRARSARAHGFGGGAVPAALLRPAFAYLMVRASFEAQRQKYPEKRPFLSTRSGGAGVRRLAQTWSGDNFTSFHDLRYCHYIGLTLSLSGLFFYGHDLGGFAGDMPSRELLLRWLQHGVFEPRFTIHSWNRDGSATMPWSYPDILGSVRALFAQRKRLLPYLYNCACRAVEREEPVNAPLFLYYGGEDARRQTDCMLVGRDVLAAFILDEGQTQTAVTLPEGDDWYLDGRLCRGGETVTLAIPAVGPAAYFARAGCVLPTDEAPYGFGKAPELVLTVYPVKSGSFTAEFFDDDGESFSYLENRCVRLQMTVRCTADRVVVQYANTGEQPFAPVFRLARGDARVLQTEPQKGETP